LGLVRRKKGGKKGARDRAERRSVKAGVRRSGEYPLQSVAQEPREDGTPATPAGGTYTNSVLVLSEMAFGQFSALAAQYAFQPAVMY